ncbi:site-specific integrase [Leucobacter chromiiresistens]|uniref:Site-specific recombinase XerD n=1 Tax=Leucobacter chromiiresistens TaxID=1079994 RepID=A0A1H1BC91_9MICO|nr:site-specific integrase [Leucobacter chromiiresistens]SDQ49480.1 Site-specific recombinase XerD [Leucobacter chromiiresistens]
MARSRNPIGSHGVIKVDELVPKVKYRARTRYRFSDGKSRQVERFDTTGPKAENKLKKALLTIEADRGGELKPSTTLRALGQQFLASKRDLGRSEGTLETYGYAVSAHITPKIGDMSIAEAKPERLQRFLTSVEKESGPGAAKNCRSTLSGMLGIAVRNGAISHNPVRELERISQRKKKGSAAIPLDQLPAFLKAIRADEKLTEWDTVELIEFMLSSGWRVAEVCALDASSIAWKAGTATVEAINVRVKGKGIVRQEFPKTEKSGRTTPLPKATMALLRRRHDRLKEFTTLLFPTPLMRPRDPSNTQREIRDRRELLGYPDLSTHSFRKTAATILDKAGLSATEIADYLGHENPSMTQDVYMNTIKGATKARDVMQSQLGKLI